VLFVNYEARTQVIREAACVPDTATCTLRIFDASGDGLQSSVIPTDENGDPIPIDPNSDEIPESFSGWFAFLHGATTIGTYQNVKWPNFSELTYCTGPKCDQVPQELQNNDEDCQDIVYLALQLDANPQDTSYQLVCNNGADIIWDGRDFTEAGSYVEEETCLPKDACCEFVITDTNTNGLTSELDTTQMIAGSTTRSTGFLYLEWNFEPIMEYDGASGEQFDVLTASFACGASASGTTDVEATTTTETETIEIDIDIDIDVDPGTDTDTETDTDANTNTETETDNNNGNDLENDTDDITDEMKIYNEMTEQMKTSNDMTTATTETDTTEEDDEENVAPSNDESTTTTNDDDPDFERRRQTAVPSDGWSEFNDDQNWETSAPTNEWANNDDMNQAYRETSAPTEWNTADRWDDDSVTGYDDDFTSKEWADDKVSWSASDEDDQVMEDDDFTMNAYVGYDDEYKGTEDEEEKYPQFVGHDDEVVEQMKELEQLVIEADGSINRDPKDEPDRKDDVAVVASLNNSGDENSEQEKKNGISKGGKIATGIIVGLVLSLGLAVLVVYFFGEKFLGKCIYDSDSDDSDGIIKDHETLETDSKEEDGVEDYSNNIPEQQV